MYSWLIYGEKKLPTFYIPVTEHSRQVWQYNFWITQTDVLNHLRRQPMGGPQDNKIQKSAFDKNRCSAFH